jgi:hypothetical protein
MKVKERTEKTYLNYINSYKKWCEKRNLNDKDAENLLNFQKNLINTGRSPRYVKQCVNVTRRNYEFSLPFECNIRISPFTKEEINTLLRFVEKNYQRDEMCLVLLLILKYDMSLSEIKKLTRFRMKQIADALGEEGDILNYALASTFDISDEKVLFRKTFSTYSAKFKQRQKQWFPNKPVRNFKDLKKALL